MGVTVATKNHDSSSSYQSDEQNDAPAHISILEAIKMVDDSLDRYDLVIPVARLVKSYIEDNNVDIAEFCLEAEMGERGVEKMKKFLLGLDCAEAYLHPMAKVCGFTHDNAPNDPILAMVYLAKEQYYIDDPSKMAQKLDSSMDALEKVLNP